MFISTDVVVVASSTTKVKHPEPLKSESDSKFIVLLPLIDAVILSFEAQSNK